MRSNKQIIQMAIVTGIIYAIVLLVMRGNYTMEEVIQVSVQGLIFMVVFGGAIWLMNRFRKKKE